MLFIGLTFFGFILRFVCSQCPEKSVIPNCSCTSTEEETEKIQVICNGVKMAEFTSMFRGVSSPMNVILQNGGFARMDSAFFAAPNIGKLTLMNNGIESISVGDFKGSSTTLRELSLKESSLRLVEDSALNQNDLPSLQRFTLADSVALERFPKLKGLANLKYVAYTNNTVRFLESGTLSDLPAVQEVDLSHNRIEIFDISTFGELPSVRKLDLTGNVISDLSFLPLVLRHLPNLNFLFLQGNKVSKIPLGFFDGLNSILTVDLSKNEIGILPASLSTNVSLTLRELYLGNNYISELPPQFFVTIPNLRTLSVANNSIKILDTQLAPLKDLLYLRLEGNKLQRIASQAFRTLARVQTITLQGNLLTVLENGVFSGMDSLISLDLSQNSIQEFHGTEIRNLTKLETFLFGGNKLRNLYAGFDSLTSLKRLDLSNNQISNIENETFAHLVSLEALQLDGNLFMKIPMNALAQLPALERLTLSNNQLLRLPVFRPLDHLKYLSLDHNSIPYIEAGTFKNLPELRQLLLNSNGINTLAAGAFTNLYRLYVLDLSGNAIQSIPPKVFDNLVALETLNLAGNDLSLLQDNTLGNLPMLRSVDFSHNLIATVTDGAFQNVPHLMQFDINRNVLNVIPSAVTKLSKVRRLDLSSNRIRRIENGQFSSLEKMENLNFQRNPICFLGDKSFATLAGLSYLDLSNTDLRHLPQGAFRSNQDFTNVILDGLAIDCDCNAKWVRSLKPNLRCVLPPIVTQMKISQVNTELMTCEEPSHSSAEQCLNLPIYTRPGAATGQAYGAGPPDVTPPSSPESQILGKGSISQAWPSKGEMEAKIQEMDAIEAARQVAGTSGCARWTASLLGLSLLIVLSLFF